MQCESPVQLFPLKMFVKWLHYVMNTSSIYLFNNSTKLDRKFFPIAIVLLNWASSDHGVRHQFGLLRWMLLFHRAEAKKEEKEDLTIRRHKSRMDGATRQDEGGTYNQREK